MAENGLFPVTYERHSGKYWKRFSSYHFAETQQACSIVEKEILRVAATYPVLFRETGGEIEPVALLSLNPDAPTPFVSDEGRWLATYIPSALRCPPFQAGLPSKTNCEPQLLVDESSGLITDTPEDEPFFTDAGELTAELLNVLRFIQAREASAKDIRSVCKVIQEMGLFEKMTSYENVALPTGYLVLDVRRLKALSQTEKLALFDVGAIQLLHAHQVSLSHISWLSQAQEQLAKPKLQKQYTENSDISRFLTAMAHAHNDELLVTGEV
ncbi:SapC family protein [Ruegeria atlantica]|uniref:SapC family protein n=1 Tax=Ruegeria atlantica TaxID=81569 RepID=UPI00249461C6|nr:SapC family protein [Ruegeria atlantica]